MNRRTFIGAATAGIVGSMTGCLRGSVDDLVTENIEEGFSPGDVDAVRVENEIGDVTVRGRETDQAEVRINKRSTAGQSGLDDIRTSIGLSGGTLTVTTEIADDARWFSRSSPSTDVTVTVPQGGDGPVVESIDSRLGDVTLLDTRGDTDASTNLGNVIARRVDGYPSLSSELGEILAEGTTGLGDATTELGDVKVELLGIRDDVEVGSQLGNVVVGVATDLSLDVVAEGEVRVRSGLELDGVQRREDRLTGTLNGGGPELRVTAELGEISIRGIDRS